MSSAQPNVVIPASKHNGPAGPIRLCHPWCTIQVLKKLARYRIQQVRETINARIGDLSGTAATKKQKHPSFSADGGRGCNRSVRHPRARVWLSCERNATTTKTSPLTSSHTKTYVQPSSKIHLAYHRCFRSFAAYSFLGSLDRVGSSHGVTLNSPRS